MAVGCMGGVHSVPLRSWVLPGTWRRG